MILYGNVSEKDITFAAVRALHGSFLPSIPSSSTSITMDQFLSLGKQVGPTSSSDQRVWTSQLILSLRRRTSSIIITGIQRLRELSEPRPGSTAARSPATRSATRPVQPEPARTRSRSTAQQPRREPVRKQWGSTILSSRNWRRRIWCTRICCFE